jgi:diacylglycerol kinase (ATP)
MFTRPSSGKDNVLAVSVKESQEPVETVPQIKRVFIVLNPVAGLTDASLARQTIEKFCEEQGWEYEIHETTPEDNLREIVHGALEKDVDLVLAAGGDGTVSGVVTGMARSNKAMGVLPAGTGNALARDLGIPIDLEAALALLKGPNQVQSMDLIGIEDDYFALNASVGVSSIIMRSTAREEKRRFGFLAYIWRGIGSVLHSDLQRFQIEVDGQRFLFSAIEVLITNTRLLGLHPQVEGVEVSPNDGRLDLYIVRGKSTRDFINILSGLFKPKDRYGDNTLRYLEVKDSVIIKSEFPLPVQADGEEIGLTPISLKVIPRALNIITPVPEEKDK